MKKRLLILSFVLLASVFAIADVVTLSLQSGEQISGEILFQNDEVVVLKNKDGKRYQYPRSEIKLMQEATELAEEEDEVIRTPKTKKVGILIDMSGGMAWLPKQSLGGNVAVDVNIGACNVAQKRIFIGGGVGYHAYFVGGKTYSFIPLQARFMAPFTEKKHAPAFGASVGYGFCPQKQGKGGMFASLDFGWRGQLQEKTALFVGVNASMQQGQISFEETVEGNIYTNTSIRTFGMLGVKLALLF